MASWLHRNHCIYTHNILLINPKGSCLIARHFKLEEVWAVDRQKTYGLSAICGVIISATHYVAWAQTHSSQLTSSSSSENKTYRLYKSAKTYQEAKDFAEAQAIDGYSGYLAVIDSSTENTRLKNWLANSVSSSEYSSTSANDGGGSAYIWLGGDDRDSEGSWYWQHPTASGFPKKFWEGNYEGQGVSGVYTNWGTTDNTQNEPDDYDFAQDALAIALQTWPNPSLGYGFELGTGGQWNDVNEFNNLYFIVEFDTIAGNGNAPDSVFRVALEEPIDGQVHTGVGNLRGWAVASSGITKVEILVDGAYVYDAPYGGSRPDVGGAFPDVDSSANSGYSLAYNYSELAAGEHTITAIAHSELGATKQQTNTFTVVKFPTANFIADPNAVDLNSASCSLRDDEILVIDSIVDGSIYDLTLKWRTAEQGFEIIEVR